MYITVNRKGVVGWVGVPDMRDVLDIMYCRSRTTTDPRTPGMPEHVGF